MDTVSNFEDWATECNRRGFKGPYRLISRPRDSYQYVGANGTAAMWNGESRMGFIFESSPDSAGGDEHA